MKHVEARPIAGPRIERPAIFKGRGSGPGAPAPDVRSVGKAAVRNLDAQIALQQADHRNKGHGGHRPPGRSQPEVRPGKKQTRYDGLMKTGSPARCSVAQQDRCRPGVGKRPHNWQHGQVRPGFAGRAQRSTSLTTERAKAGCANSIGARGRFEQQAAALDLSYTEIQGRRWTARLGGRLFRCAPASSCRRGTQLMGRWWAASIAVYMWLPTSRRPQLTNVAPTAQPVEVPPSTVSMAPRLKGHGRQGLSPASRSRIRAAAA